MRKWQIGPSLLLTAFLLASCQDADTEPDSGAPPPADAAEPPDAAPALAEIRATVAFQTVRTQYGVTCSTTDIAGEPFEIVFADLAGSPYLRDVPCAKPTVSGNTISLDCKIHVISVYLQWDEIHYLNLYEGWEGWSGQYDIVVDGQSYFFCDLQYEVLAAELIWNAP